MEGQSECRSDRTRHQPYQTRSPSALRLRSNHEDIVVYPEETRIRTTQTYPQRVRERILPLSIADTLSKAFEEWHFTGNTVDHEEPCETCELCGQEGLRYHFEIFNDYTWETLQVGSHCILKFNVAVYEGDRKLSPKDAKKKLDKLIEQKRIESCIKALEDVVWTENSESLSDILENALAYYRKNRKLTPKQAFVVFWRLRRNRIKHDPSFFKITLKNRCMEDLKNMETSRVHLFWRALTSRQRRQAVALGHAPPPPSQAQLNTSASSLTRGAVSDHVRRHDGVGSSSATCRAT